MRKAAVLFLLLALMFPVSAMAGEKEVLKAFETLKASSGAPDRKYDELLRDAQVELNILKRSPTADKDFLDTAQECNKQFSRVAFSQMMAKESGIAAERARKSSAEIRAAMQPYFDARKKSMDEAAVLLDKLYTFVK